MDLHVTGSWYLQHLTDSDVAVLAIASGLGGEPGQLRSKPAIVAELLLHDAVHRAVFARGDSDALLHASPALVFAVAVHRVAADLRQATFVQEWTGPRQRVPVFDVDPLRDFLADALRRFFLVELLTSYTHVTSGSVWMQTRRGLRRRRFSELDPLKMAQLVELVGEAERAGVYRRLGDLSLFLTGVFPDHATAVTLRPIDAARLSRAAGLPDSVGKDRPASMLLEELGARWYGLAADAAPVAAGTMRVVTELRERFADARRVLNVVTDRYLFDDRGRWFPAAGS